MLTLNPKDMPSTLYYYDRIRRDSSGDRETDVAKIPCLAGEVRWHSESKACFQPTQLHINILAIESVLLVFAALAILVLTRKIRSLNLEIHSLLKERRKP
jgi:hypothetical protein